MQDYNEIQYQIDQLTNTTQDERHGKQFREQQACERRLKQIQTKRNKVEKRNELKTAKKG